MVYFVSFLFLREQQHDGEMLSTVTQIADDAGDAVSMIYLAPPVTAFGTKNPSMRLYYLDPGSFQLIDYDQFYLDLKSVAPPEFSTASHSTTALAGISSSCSLWSTASIIE